jgi:hypothetical protein
MSSDDKKYALYTLGLVVFFTALILQRIYAPNLIRDLLTDGKPWEKLDTTNMLLTLLVWGHLFGLGRRA